MQRKTKPFLTLKNRIFQTPKNRTFSKGHTFGQHMPFFLDFDLIKIRLEIMLSDFKEKKETFLALKAEFLKVQKIAFFQRG